MVGALIEVDLGVPGSGRRCYGEGGMTRDELFEHYVADTLDEAVIAELGKLFAEDPAYAAQFAKDLVATGKFKEVGSELQRIEPKRPKLIMGDAADLPKALQFLGVGEKPPPGFYDKAAVEDPEPEPPGPAEVMPPVESLVEEVEEVEAYEEEEVEEVEERVRPAAVRQPPPPPEHLPSYTQAPPAAEVEERVRPAAVRQPPPPPEHLPSYTQAPPGAEVFGHAHGSGFARGHHGQPALRSATRSSPIVFIIIAVFLALAIGIALFIGLNREAELPPEGDSVIAKVDFLEGDVVYIREVGEIELAPGVDLKEGDRINVRHGSVRIAYVGEKSYLHVRSGSEITIGDHQEGKEVRLSLGEVTVEAALQPIGKPMIVQSDNARATFLGAKVTMRSLGKETLVEVSQGTVLVERLRDRTSVQLGAGAWTLVSGAEPPLAWEFMAGVNLNGGEVEIDGNKWMSDAGAKTAGLQVTAIGKAPEMRTSVQQPVGYVPSPGLRSVLKSKVVASKTKLAIKWPQANARYQVFVWMLEDEGDSVRALRLNVEEKLVGSDLGKEQVLGGWNRFGPYQADVKDGVLDFLLSADSKFQNHDPHLSGIAIYRLGSGGAPVPAPTSAVPAAPLVPARAPSPGTPPAVVPTIPD